MTAFGKEHIVMLLATVIFLISTCIAVRKMNYRWQNVTFGIAAVFCAGGIFYRYALGLSFNNGINLKTLALQMLQVCNFNFILVFLMLIPKMEIARQYSVYFSMFAAMTTFVSVSPSWANYDWYSPTVLNSWLNHLFAVALPLWMLSSGRLKPQKKYILPVAVCVFVYFTAVYLCSEVLIFNGVITQANSYSFIYNTDQIPLFVFLQNLIPYPYFYLYPLFPFMIGFFWILSKLFKKKNTMPFSQKKRR